MSTRLYNQLADRLSERIYHTPTDVWLALMGDHDPTSNPPFKPIEQ